MSQSFENLIEAIISKRDDYVQTEIASLVREFQQVNAMNGKLQARHEKAEQRLEEHLQLEEGARQRLQLEMQARHEKAVQLEEGARQRLQLELQARLQLEEEARQRLELENGKLQDSLTLLSISSAAQAQQIGELEAILNRLRKGFTNL